MSNDPMKEVRELLQNATLADIDPLPNGIKQYLMRRENGAANAPPGDVRRHPRIPVQEQAIAVRVNEAGQAVGRPFQVYVKDISSSGLGFVHTRAFGNDTLAIRLVVSRGPTIVMLGQIVRCSCSNRLYEVGVRFTGRLMENKNAGAPQEKQASAAG